jgi:hypothetical protein
MAVDAILQHPGIAAVSFYGPDGAARLLGIKPTSWSPDGRRWDFDDRRRGDRPFDRKIRMAARRDRA